MAIKHIITQGIGPGASTVKFIPTRGFIAGSAAPPKTGAGTGGLHVLIRVSGRRR